MLKKRIMVILGAAVMMFGNTALIQAEEAVPENCIQNISYIEDENEDHMLDVYGTEGITDAAPTIIEVHGGGFFGGTKETNIDHSQYYNLMFRMLIFRKACRRMMTALPI